MAHRFLAVWSQWRPSSPPYFLPEDEPYLSALHEGAHSCHASWTSYIRSFDFARRANTALHLGLLPQPYFGDPATARVVVLALNPGVGPHDYFGEYEVPAFRRALLRSRLRSGRRQGFLFLDPRFSWHGGFGYWHGRLRGVIERLADHWQVPIHKAHSRFARLFATIELLPYHSASFEMPVRILHQLPSVRLARSFVKDVLLRRAAAGRCLVVISRSAGLWGLPSRRNVLLYRGPEARAAFLTPGSRGGRRILTFLRKQPAIASQPHMRSTRSRR